MWSRMKEGYISKWEAVLYTINLIMNDSDNEHPEQLERKSIYPESSREEEMPRIHLFEP